jgi:hypothetical protein
MGRGFAAALAAHPAEKPKRLNVGPERKSETSGLVDEKRATIDDVMDFGRQIRLISR